MNTHKKRMTNRRIGLGTLTSLTLALALLPGASRPALASRLTGDAQQAAGQPGVSALGRDHWQAIAAGNLAGVMGGYGPDAVLHWDGGAFDGDHAGTAALQTVWSRFIQARAPLQVRVGDIRETRGERGSRIVTAAVVFRSHDWTYPVLSRLVFHAGRIVEETWHIETSEDGPPEAWRMASRVYGLDRHFSFRAVSSRRTLA